MTNFYTDKQQIINWLDKYQVKNYKLVQDEKYGFIVDVNDEVDLSDKNLNNIPVKFNEINGSFFCSKNQLTSLEFSPQNIDRDFDCVNNQLTSLEYCPKTVGGYFDCSNNRLTSLEFCPEIVSGYFYCHDNPELKEIQKKIDFNSIYLEYKKALITNFSNKLENELNYDKSRKTTKIKI